MTRLDRQDILLVLADGARGEYHFDPVRAMKACFIVSQDGRPEWREEFDFRPYDYGPFDPSVYRARDALIAKGLLASERRGRYAAYVPTPAGRARVAELQDHMEAVERRWLAQVAYYVSAKSFEDLLSAIYSRYPQYAERTVVPHLR